MDDGLEAKKQTLIKLLQRLGLTVSSETLTDLLQISELSHPVTGSNSTSPSLTSEDLLLRPGEIPAVQDRFHALLKRRLLIEAQRKPPLFPWEDETTEYEVESADQESNYPVLAGASVWMTQLRQLSLPVPLPESVLTQLLERCQGILCSSLKEGAKLVRAVESLFPEQDQLLHDIAGYVMISPARSSLQQEVLPQSYEAAIDAQQMVLSLLAAREIMNTLTLTVSPKQPQFEREWLTDLGAFTLRAAYDFDTGVRLRIDAEFPCGGSLQFQGQEFRSTAERDDAGRLSLEIRDFAPDRVYPLEVRLGEQDLLTFAIAPQSEG